MGKYFAVVRFECEPFEAAGIQEANDVMNDLIDSLGDIETNISWDNVEWTFYEGEGN